MLLLLIAGVVGAFVRQRGEAAEAAISLDSPDGLAKRLSREGYALAGEPRRKGRFIVVVAVKGGAPWRLVIDSANADIVGRKPVVALIGANTDR
ncbi:MAG: hypothetical protein ACRC7G_08475 [Beijerinckiaceae bacterium]